MYSPNLSGYLFLGKEGGGGQRKNDKLVCINLLDGYDFYALVFTNVGFTINISKLKIWVFWLILK